VHSVKLCISGNLSVGSVTLYKSVWHCIGKGWFADVGDGLGGATLLAAGLVLTGMQFMGDPSCPYSDDSLSERYDERGGMTWVEIEGKPVRKAFMSPYDNASAMFSCEGTYCVCRYMSHCANSA